MKKKLIYIVGSLLLAISAISIYIYTCRTSIAESYLSEKLIEIENKYDFDIKYDNLEVLGINSVFLNNLKIIPKKEKFFSLFLNKAEVQIDLISLLKDKFYIRTIRMDGLTIKIEHGDAENNSNSPQDSSFCLISKLQKFTKRFSTLTKILTPESDLPNDILLTEVNISIGNKKHKTLFYLPEVTFLGNSVYSQILIKENFINEVGSNSFNNNQYFIIEGDLKSIGKENNFKFYSLGDESTEIPFFKQKFNTSLKFDTLFLKATINKNKNDDVIAKGNLAFFNLFINNPRISKNELQINYSDLQFQTLFSDKYFEIDSSSVFRINDIEGKVHLYLGNKKNPIVQLSLKTDSFPSSNLFNSLPSGCCNNLRGIETEGNLLFNLQLKLDMENIDSLKFASELSSKSFNITKYGTTDFREANGPMLYNVFDENNQLEIQYEMSEENVNFRKLEDISPYLKSAVMFSEDGMFFHHKGFIDEAIRASIIKNIKEKRFARGGSTISMQLVKNLWLSKDKTASRKLEEALIVWMIENERLVSKERMLELYLNIIEWGPHIYGASQASHFYFNKDVDKLSLNEAIFMASIIPRPKKFHWYFDKERKLKPFLQDYYQLIGTKMLKRGVITERQLEKLEANVKISGHAIAYLHHAKDEDITLKTDTTSFNNLIKTDSLRIIDDLNLYFPNDENIQNQSN